MKYKDEWNKTDIKQVVEIAVSLIQNEEEGKPSDTRNQELCAGCRDILKAAIGTRRLDKAKMWLIIQDHWSDD